MFLFVAVLIAGFAKVGRILQEAEAEPVNTQFLTWTLGCILFGHAVTFSSISYFDQTVVFLYLALACIGSLQVGEPASAPLELDDAEQRAPISLPYLRGNGF